MSVEKHILQLVYARECIYNKVDEIYYSYNEDKSNVPYMVEFVWIAMNGSDLNKEDVKAYRKLCRDIFKYNSKVDKFRRRHRIFCLFHRDDVPMYIMEI